MKNLFVLAVFGAFSMVAACSSSDDTSGTGGADGGGATGGGGTGTGGTGTGGSTGGMAGMGAMGGMAGGGAMGGAAGSAGDGGGMDCATCIQTNCGTELGACTANTECMAIVQCQLTCTDTAACDQCVTDHPNGKTLFDAVEACGTQKCAVECQ